MELCELVSAPPFAMLWRSGLLGEAELIALGIVFGSLALVPLGLAWIRHRRRGHEERLRLVRELAAEGKLGREQLERLLLPPSRLGTFGLVVAWFALFGGIGLLLNALFSRFPDDDEILAGFLLVLFALAALSTPIMLREMRKQQAS